MGDLVNQFVEVSTFGLVEDITGQEAAAQAAQQAGTLQQQAALAAEQGIQQRFETTQEMIRPQVEAGDIAREQQLQLLGLRGAEEQATAFGGLQESPSQRFLRERGQRELLQNAAAIGGLDGGNVREALVQRGVGFAQQDLENQLARLSGLSGAGQVATTNIGQLGAGAAQQAGQFGQAGAAAQASGILGAQQAAAQGTQQVLQLGGAAIGAFTGGAGGAALGAGAGGIDPFAPLPSIPSIQLF